MSPPAAFVMPWLRSMTKEEPAAPRVSRTRLRESNESGVLQVWLPPVSTEREPAPVPKEVPAASTSSAPIGVVAPTLPPKVTVPVLA